MVKHIQPIHRKVPTKCFDVFNHFVGLARKGRSIDFHKMFWFLLHYRTHLFIWVKTINVKLFSNLKHFELRVSIPFLVPLSPERVTFKVCVGGFRLIYAMLLKEISQDIFDEKKLGIFYWTPQIRNCTADWILQFYDISRTIILQSIYSGYCTKYLTQLNVSENFSKILTAKLFVQCINASFCFNLFTKLAFTCSKSTIGTLQKDVKYVQSYQ